MKETQEILTALVAKEHELETKVEQLKDAENELIKVQAAIKALSPDIKDLKVVVSTNNKIFAGGAQYNPKGTWKEKIKYVVTIKGHAGIKSVAEFICDKQPELDPKKVYGSVAVNIGAMVNKQQSLKAKTMNGKKEYFLND